MKTKKGVIIPSDLAEALKSLPDMLVTFERMRPSCHSEYADYVEAAKDPETRRKRIEIVLKRIADWGERHPSKASKRND